MFSYDFKVVLLGQGSVGKTSLVLRYVSGVFNDTHQSTFQASFLRKQLYLDRDLVRLNLWDTAGQEKYHALGPIYYRGAQGAILLYDVTKPDTLQKVKEWVRELNKSEGIDRVKLCIVGNKIDLLQDHQTNQAKIATRSKHSDNDQNINQNERDNHKRSNGGGQLIPSQYSYPIIQEAIKFTNEIINARHYLTSAKQNHGLNELFISISKRMIDQHKKRAGCNYENFPHQTSRPNRDNVVRTLSMAEDVDEDEVDRRDRWPPIKLTDAIAAGDKKQATCHC